MKLRENCVFSSQVDTEIMKVKLSMVAQLAGVSPSTVSRILNGTAHVDPEKHARVMAVINELGFRPNPAARALAGGKTSTVGVITQFIDSPFYGEALRGIEDVLTAAHYVPLFASGHWNEKNEHDCIDFLRQRKVDGIIALSSCLNDETLVGIAQDTPIVITGRSLLAHNVTSIDFDNLRAAKMAVEHLLKLGHRQIAYISGPMNHSDAQDRLAGYKAALPKGASTDPRLVVASDFLEEGGVTAMNRLLDSGVSFTAVVTGNDQMAFGARLALHRKGLRVPQDISLVGFDDLPIAQYLTPPLTTVRHSARELGAQAAQSVLSLIAGKPLKHPVLKARLMVRESTSPLSNT